MAVGLRALEEKNEALAALLQESGVAALQAEIETLDADIKAYVLDSEENYEDDKYKLTRVQGFRRHWDTDKLEKILPRGIFKNAVTIQADPQKIDQLVRDGKVKMNLIAPAYVEVPNTAYVKVSRKRNDEQKGDVEAAALAEALGA